MDFPRLESEKRQETSPWYQSSRKRGTGLGILEASERESLTFLMASIPTVLVCAFPSTAAVMASMGFRLSVVSIFVGLEEFNGLFYVDDDLAALLHDGGGKEGVLVALRSEVGAVEQGLDAFEAIDVTFSVALVGLDGCAGAVQLELAEEFFEVADGEGGDGGGFIKDHNRLDLKFNKTQPVVQVFLLALEQRYIAFSLCAIC